MYCQHENKKSTISYTNVHEYFENIILCIFIGKKSTNFWNENLKKDNSISASNMPLKKPDDFGLNRKMGVNF